jgi:hypothetical protein
MGESELVDWTVVLIDNSQAKEPIEFAGEQVGLTTRSYYRAGMGEEDTVPIEGDYTIRRLADPLHESLDLDELETERAETMRSREQERLRIDAEQRGIDASTIRPLAFGPFVRKVRPVRRGLLALYLLAPEKAGLSGVVAIPGFLVSFPDSPGAPTIQYVIPRRYWEQEVA